MTSTEKVTQKKSNGAAGALAPVPSEPASSAVEGKLAVSEQFTITGDDAETVKVGLKKMHDLQLTYAEKAEAFKREEVQLLTAIEKARSAKNETVIMIGNKNGLKIEEFKYDFNDFHLTFTRLA